MLNETAGFTYSCGNGLAGLQEVAYANRTVCCASCISEYIMDIFIRSACVYMPKESINVGTYIRSSYKLYALIGVFINGDDEIANRIQG